MRKISRRIIQRTVLVLGTRVPVPGTWYYHSTGSSGLRRLLCTGLCVDRGTSYSIYQEIVGYIVPFFHLVLPVLVVPPVPLGTSVEIWLALRTAKSPPFIPSIEPIIHQRTINQQ